MGIAGAAVALNYGYNWITGQKLQSRTVINTGNIYLDYTRVGMWLLGEGEMDGLIELWDSALGRLLAQNESDNTSWLHFHPGCDAVPGSGFLALSTGGDQGVDSFFTNLPPGIQPLHYNRWAYYAIQLKQLINNPPNTNQDDASVWADINPIGLWRGLRCRMFDSKGNLIGYGFTRNPAWHFVDLYCRRKLFPEYSIDRWNGPDDLPAAARNRFDFGALAEAASYFAELLPNGMPRFAGDYSFSQKTTLQACTTQILTCSRSFFRERAGQYSIVPDKPRASVFTFSRANADAFVPSDADTHSAASMYTAKYRDLLPPAFATIASIVCPDHQNPVVTTEGPHSAVAGDYVVIGNTGTAYDTNWQVVSVPDTGGNPVYTLTLKSRGSNYPEAIGAGGLIGFRFSRFHERAPQFQHKAFQRALGAVGVGLPRQRNKRNKDTDFANCTWDQVARITKYQRALELGPDVTPYVPPPRATLKAPLFAPDAAGRDAVAVQIEAGDVVTIDSTLSDAYKGDYEVFVAAVTPIGSSSGQGMARTPDAGGIQFTLRPYDGANNYPEENQGNEPGWPTVPMLPGNPGTETWIPLASGDAVFFTGSLASGDSFDLPDGCNAQNMLCWASPQGFVEGDAHLHYIQDCDAYQTRICTLIYNDSAGATWKGDMNYCGIAWRTSTAARRFSVGPMNYVELTLLGGEKVIFGKGILGSETQVSTPDNYEVNKLIALAFPKSASDGGKPTHGFASWVDQAGALHHKYMWAPDEVWEGNGQAFIFGALNNNGTWRADGNGWMHCALPDGRTLAVAGQSLMTRMPTAFYGVSNLPQITGDYIPAMPGMSSRTIQCMPTSDGFDYNADHPAHGVKQCTADRNTLQSVCLWEDGDGNQWGGSNSIFSLLCDTPTGPLGGQPIPADPTRWPGPPNTAVTGGGGAGTDGGGGVAVGGSGVWNTPEQDLTA